MTDADRTDPAPSRGPATVREVEAAARELFGLDRLRDGQAEAMTAVLSGRDVLAGRTRSGASPIGWGRSGRSP